MDATLLPACLLLVLAMLLAAAMLTHDAYGHIACPTGRHRRPRRARRTPRVLYVTNGVVL